MFAIVIGLTIRVPNKAARITTNMGHCTHGLPEFFLRNGLQLMLLPERKAQRDMAGTAQGIDPRLRQFLNFDLIANMAIFAIFSGWQGQKFYAQIRQIRLAIGINPFPLAQFPMGDGGEFSCNI